MPSAAVSTTCARGCRGGRRTRADRSGTAAGSPSAATVISAAGSRSSAKATSATSTTARPIRKRCGISAAGAGTANWPTTAAAGARPGRRRSPRMRSQSGPSPRGASGGIRTARSTRLRGRRSGTPGIPRWGLRRRFGPVLIGWPSADEKIADQVVDIGRAEPGDQVVAGPGGRRRRCRRGSRRGRRAAVHPRRCDTAAG